MPVATPPVIPQPFAESGDRAVIPDTTVATGRASYEEGFPAETMQPKVSGGVPPDGRDMNGILYALSAHALYTQAGQQFKYDSAVSTAIGGYGVGTILESADGTTQWLNLVAANTSDPDASGAGWVPITSYGISPITGLAGGTRTLTNVEAQRDVITLSGTLVANQSIVLPTDLRSWRIVNLTTGSFTTTVRTSGGVGVEVPQGGYSASVGVYGNGTDIFLEVPPVALPIDVNPTADTIAKRNNAADLFARYFNSSAPTETFTASAFIGQAGTDGYLRKMAVADVAAQLKATVLASAALTGTPTTPTAAVGTNTTQVASTSFATNAGVGSPAQAWQGVSRALNTAYTNSTGRPIQVMAVISCPASPLSRFQVFINGNALTFGVGNGGSGSIDLPVSFIVPSGNTYSINTSSGSPSLQSWVELR